MNKLNLIFLLIICTACLPDEAEFEGFRRADIQRLLSEEGQKIWVLEERILTGEALELQDCEIPRQLIFNFTTSATDNDSLWYVNYAQQCSEKDTLKGFWYVPVLTNAFAATDTVAFVWESMDTTFFQLNTISPLELEIETIAPKDSLVERFRN